MYRILLYLLLFTTCRAQINDKPTVGENENPSEIPSTDSKSTEDNKMPSHQGTTTHQGGPTIEQLVQSLSQLQQQYQQLIGWQENTNKVFQQRLDNAATERANMQQGLQSFTQNTHVRLLELERTYAKSFLFTAFTATGTEAKTFRGGSTIEFKHIVTNEGGAYNQESSVFNCQYDGFFHFQFIIFSSGDRPVEVQLVNAGKPVISGYAFGKNTNEVISNSAVLFCEGGDQVMLKVKNDFQQYLEFDGIHSTFSGYAVAAVEP